MRIAVAAAFLLCLCARTLARADEPGTAPPDAHGSSAPASAFPSHHFQLAAHQPAGVELAFHYGLVQPIVLHGFNAAVDVRWRRLIVSYSHGASLDFDGSLPDSERAAGVRAEVPYSTGGGVGVVLIDELYVLVDFKVHRFDLSLGADRASYTTVTIGGEVGWRFFVWKGLFVTPVVRYWPNVWTSAPDGGVAIGTIHHQPLTQGKDGLFVNVLVGWAFNL